MTVKAKPSPRPPAAPQPPAGTSDPWLWERADAVRRAHQAGPGEVCPACLQAWPCEALGFAEIAVHAAIGERLVYDELVAERAPDPVTVEGIGLWLGSRPDDEA